MKGGEYVDKSAKRVLDDTIKLRSRFTELTKQLSSVFGGDAVVSELMYARKYHSVAMYETLGKQGVFKVTSDAEFMVVGATQAELKQFGVVNENGYCILSGRYVVPIRDVCGNVIAFVGWRPNSSSLHKYVTTPTKGFARNAYFFNMQNYESCMKKNRGITFLVEGIFDTLSLQSLGFSALGNMGIPLSRYKADILKRYNKVICAPDNDKTGQSVIPFGLYRGKNLWDVPVSKTFIKLPVGVKDIDDLIREYKCSTELQQSYDAGLVYHI